MEVNLRYRLIPAQIRGARGMLNWSMSNLAQAAGVSISTVKRAEDAGPQPVSDDAVLTIRAALEAVGISFLDDTGSGAGVRIQPR